MKACNNKATQKKLTGKGEHMKLKENEVVLEGRSGKICIKRNSYGIPEIKASTRRISGTVSVGYMPATGSSRCFSRELSFRARLPNISRAIPL